MRSPLPEAWTTSPSTGTAPRPRRGTSASCRQRNRTTTAWGSGPRDSTWGSSMRVRALKNNGGLTLIEVLVSLVIVFIVFIGISGSGLLVLEENIKNSLRDEAVSVAEMAVQEARRLAFTSLVSDNAAR